MAQRHRAQRLAQRNQAQWLEQWQSATGQGLQWHLFKRTSLKRGRSFEEKVFSVEHQKKNRKPLQVKVQGTQLQVEKPDGEIAAQEELVGALLLATGPTGVSETYRIDAITQDPRYPKGEIYLYTFSASDPQTGEWRNICKPDPDGLQMGFPLAGYWNAEGAHIQSDTEYSITCTSGVIGKCVRFGYFPWKKSAQGQSLWKIHQACTRMLRADYCGNGNPHTRNGTLIELFDRVGIQRDTKEPDLSFEAAWNENGATCLKKTRIKEIATLDSVLKECPQKLENQLRDNCVESFSDKVLILNRS